MKRDLKPIVGWTLDGAPALSAKKQHDAVRALDRLVRRRGDESVPPWLTVLRAIYKDTQKARQDRLLAGILRERRNLWPAVQAAIDRLFVGLSRVRWPYAGPEAVRLATIAGKLRSFDPEGAWPVPDTPLTDTQLKRLLIDAAARVIWPASEAACRERGAGAVTATLLRAFAPRACRRLTPDAVRKALKRTLAQGKRRPLH